MQLRTRDSPGQGKYVPANIANSEDGSVVFPPTSRNTLAEAVSYCEAYISCTIRTLANKPYEEPFCDDGGCTCSCVLARRRKCRVNHVELVRAYMCKHCLTVDMFTGLASAIPAAQKSQLLAQGPPAKNVRQHRQNAR